MNQKHIKVEKTARYFVLGEVTESIKSIWFVLHGYGQLAEEFLKNFEGIASESTLIIAPEAFNKFYIKGFSGKIGATWLTKEDRGSDIEDYINFLNAVFDDAMSNISNKDVKINVLGFSQGTAAACRWLENKKVKADHLVLWGGKIPPDIDLSSTQELFNSLSLEIVLGTNDKFVSEEQIQKERELLEKNKINFSIHRYEGRHELTTELLAQYFHGVL